jgi:hypothetical protein
MANENIFTPYLNKKTKLRAYLTLSDEDAMKIPIDRTQPWRVVVTDRFSGLTVTATDADCGLGCHCGAVITRIQAKK